MSNQFSKLAKTIFLMSVLFLFGSCSKINPFYTKPTDPVRLVLIKITDTYLQHIASGNFLKARNMIFAEEYFPAKGKGFTNENYQQQFDYIQNRWTPNEHPFLGTMEFVKAGVLKDKAYVVVKKKGENEQAYPEIRIDYIWIGTGWLIINDSIFGPNEIIANLMSENK
jgi:hypothetical protein